ncbi:hypothetical protein MRS44_001999 [Fusarium solani]|uniref:uncharacterized protein n=1 Tax=Fusarium solani TaxID=169388 RepID=UPI0032C42199|nr:hypothetical protein MRS44_001999 [Fusarium solani]
MLQARISNNQHHCGFATSADSGATCSSFADEWGLTVDELKSLNPGISCPDIDTDGLYCVVGTDNDDEPTTVVPSSTARVSTRVSSSSTTTTSKPTVTVKLSPTQEPGNGIETPSPIEEGMVSNYNKFHLISPTTTCEGVLNYHKISLADFGKWNPAVGKGCSGLWTGTNACVGVVGDKPTPTTTAGNDVTTPTPIQAEVVKDCIKFHYISPTTTCQGVLSYNKITMEQFAKWNPAVGKDCSGLWKETHACVAVS